MLNHLLGRQVVFLFATILGAHPSGQYFALLKIVPDDFFSKKQRLYRGKNVIMSQVFSVALVALL
jgi:hypothetical protein